jgi:UDPglucose 6-dehydrogenase
MSGVIGLLGVQTMKRKAGAVSFLRSVMKVGIVGLGVIGGALYKACQVKGMDVVGYDKYVDGPNAQTLPEILKTDLTFLCLPSPTKGKQQELGALHETLLFLNKNSYRGVAVVRSTVIPGTTDALQEVFPNVPLAHCPEFLTAATPFEDLIKQKAILVGGSDLKARTITRDFWHKFDKKVPVYELSSARESEMAKYIHNCFLATKVTFFNEIYEICKSADIHFDEAVSGAMALGQIGEGHAKVPGPDGSLGFGGMCFVKDTAAMLGFSKNLGLLSEVVSAVVEKNKRIRPQAYDGQEKTGYSAE